MKILVLADLMEQAALVRKLLEPADLVLSCGDVFPEVLKVIHEELQVPIFGVHGNHDPAYLPEFVEDLHLATRSFAGYLLGGFEGSWRYKPRGRFLYTDEEVHKLLAEFPAVDIFVAHNPPRGINDIDDGVHNGFAAFRNYIDTHNPVLFLHGHVHKSVEQQLVDTRVVSVAGVKSIELPSQRGTSNAC